MIKKTKIEIKIEIRENVESNNRRWPISQEDLTLSK